MLYVCFLAIVTINLSFYTNNVESATGNVLFGKREPAKIIDTMTKTNTIITGPKNETIIQKGPTLAKLMNTNKHSTKHNNKKYPKRTIQKIIKKSRKNRSKMFLNQITSPQTEPSPVFEQKEESTTTTQATIRKKPKKWNTKFARNPLPFHKLSAMGPHKKTKREIDRDIFILQDLDEIEFMSDENGPNAIIAHVKKYW